MSNINYNAMSDTFTFVPAHMRHGYKLWIEQGIPPGSFGVAVLSNDLRGACGSADAINKNCIVSTIAWFFNYAPSRCWGSVENFENWKGLEHGKTAD